MGDTSRVEVCSQRATRPATIAPAACACAEAIQGGKEIRVPNQLSAIKHIVQLMLEHRSFDQMLDFLYAGTSNVAPNGQPFVCK